MALMQLTPHIRGLTVQTLPDSYTDGLSPAMRMMGAQRMHEAGFDGAGMKVGILDSGIDDMHPDFKGCVVNRRDYIKDGLRPYEFHAHGTHVAGIVGARGQLRGMAPACEIIDYRVLGKDGSGTWQNVALAVMQALTDGCDAINLSLGGPEDVPALHDAIRAFVNVAPVLVAAGNEGAQTISYPAYYPEVIAIGAGVLWPDGKWYRAYFSTTNPEVDAMAPGYEVLSCAPGGGYLYMSGTSQGAPHATGLMALYLQRGKARLGRRMSETAAWEGFKCGTVDVDALGIDAASGAGFATIYPSFREPMTVQVTEGSDTALVDGQAVPLVPGYPQAVAETRNGFFSLPMAFMARLWRGDKAWNEQTRTGTFTIPRE